MTLIFHLEGDCVWVIPMDKVLHMEIIVGARSGRPELTVRFVNGSIESRRLVLKPSPNAKALVVALGRIITPPGRLPSRRRVRSPSSGDSKRVSRRRPGRPPDGHSPPG